MQEPRVNHPGHSDNEDGFASSNDLLRLVCEALEHGDHSLIARRISDLHAADLAELLNLLSHEQREAVVAIISAEFDPEVLPHLSADVRDEVIEQLGAEKSAAAIATLDSDDALTVIEDMDEEERAEILQAVPEETREELEEALSYPDSSAGRLMRRELVSVPEYWTVGDSIDYLRAAEHLPEDFYVIFVVDPKFHPVGTLMLSRIMQSKRDVSVRSIMDTDLNPIPTGMDQEEVAHIFRKYGLVEAPVTNADGRMVGAITVDDVVEVIQEEGEEDLMRLGGLSAADFHAGLLDTVKRRFPWLLVNLITATVASRVIGHFGAEIQQWVILAVLMPIIASIGGNAGIQAVTVAVRALTTRQLRGANAAATIRKEVCIGIANGMALAVLSAATLFLVYGNAALALTFGLALILNLIVGGLAGAVVPITFSRLKLDPAIASGVFVTMLTDATGFFVFLGLASLMLG